MDENRIIRTQYAAILRYCCMKLGGDVAGAEDCTQEVFLALHRKRALVRDENITGWLYAAADREVKTYRRKNPPHLSDADIPEPSVPPEVERSASPLDGLGETDRRLMAAYYGGADRTALAAEYGLSRDALYQRVHRLRQKLRGQAPNRKGEEDHENKAS